MIFGLKKDSKKLNKLPDNRGNIPFGCDPEFFFRDIATGKIVGSEKILPPAGLIGSGSIVRDGIQAELNPPPNVCREMLGRNIQRLFAQMLQNLPNGISIDLSQLVEITQEEMDSLSPDSKKFGCLPSYNAHGKRDVAVKDASKYLKRSAGGHIHIGQKFEDPDKLIKLMDVIVGNTCVLLDRDPGNIERRKNYGRAGEYRLPPHGIEYRTLSNFWLRSHHMFSFVIGLVRQACKIMESGQADVFLNAVKMRRIVRAINNNNFSLALQNFEDIKSLLLEVTPVSDYYAIHEANIEEFYVLVHGGLDEFAPAEGAAQLWANIDSFSEDGWGDFARNVLAPRIIRSIK